MTESESSIAEPARAHGAVMTEVEGVTTPAHFGDPAAEYRVLRNGAAIVDLAADRVLRVSGSDRCDFLQGMLSNDVKARAAGQGCRAFVLTDQGKVVADVAVLVDADEILLVGATSGVTVVPAALERYIVADDVDVTPSGASEHVLGLFGPGAVTALTALGLSALPTGDYDHACSTTDEGPIRLVRVPVPGAGGYLCVLPAASAAAWWSRVVTSGAASPVGCEAHELWRIEGGVARYGRDVTSDTIALEAPFGDAISFRKGCYLGQEIVERVTARGKVNRRLVGLVLADGGSAKAGDRISGDDREVGWVTSVAWSWDRDRYVALGYVRREYLEPGTTLGVQAAAGLVPATVTTLPFG